MQITAPLAWTTLTLTIDADGHAHAGVEGASPFPRHWIYDAQGRLTSKTGSIDFESWYRQAFGSHTPWGETDSPAFVTEVETALERKLSRQIMRGGARARTERLRAGETLVEQGAPGDSIFLLLDGVLDVVVDGEPPAGLRSRLLTSSTRARSRKSARRIGARSAARVPERITHRRAVGRPLRWPTRARPSGRGC